LYIRCPALSNIVDVTAVLGGKCENGSIINGEHKVIPIKPTVFVTTGKGQLMVKVKISSDMHMYIIPANYWYHY
jgi:hypothetical protein